MSTKTTVEVSEDADGQVRAIEAESGAMGTGDSISEALVELARKIAVTQEDVAMVAEIESADFLLSEPDPSPGAAALLELGESVRERFDAADVSESDVDEAINWARSRSSPIRTFWSQALGLAENRGSVWWRCSLATWNS